MKSARLLITLSLAAGLIGFLVWKSSQTAAPAAERIGFQDADTPLGMPERGEPDPRFDMLSAWRANQIPLMTRMDVPMGSENGALVYNAQEFMELNDKRGGYHAGDDLNGIGGMNTDLGDPVFAAGDGLVVFAGEPSAGWGKTIILAHRTADGEALRTMYSHLDSIKTTLGSLVARGETIGTVGTANDHYPAHLHFEIRRGNGVDLGAGYVAKPLTHVDPSEVIASFHDSSAEGILPAPLAFAELMQANPWTSVEIKGAEKFTELKE
jgi:hypothetical protein